MVGYTLCIMYKGEIINPKHFKGGEKKDLFDTVMFEVMVGYTLCIMYKGEIINLNDFMGVNNKDLVYCRV
jgi:hypothetical protein